MQPSDIDHDMAETLVIGRMVVFLAGLGLAALAVRLLFT